MTIAATVDAMVTHVQALTGLKRVFDDPPDSMSEFPCAVVYALRGEMGHRIGKGVCASGEHVIVVEIHHARQVLPQAVAASQTWPDQLFAQMLGSSTLNVQYPVRYEAGALEYNKETHYGVRFEITVRD